MSFANSLVLKESLVEVADDTNIRWLYVEGGPVFSMSSALSQCLKSAHNLGLWLLCNQGHVVKTLKCSVIDNRAVHRGYRNLNVQVSIVKENMDGVVVILVCNK